LAGTTALNPLLSYTVTVGAGGIAGTYASGGTGIGGSGGNSLLGSLVTSTGGGGGGGGNATGSIGNNGGSGGGGAGVGNNAGGTGVSGQGFAGASGTSNNTGGGGGGSSAVGSSKNGGNGTASSISGTSTTYAGGGAAFAASGGGTAGTGGGGAVNTSGTANLGGGGGADNGSGAGQGGSGIVIISYAGAQQFGGGVVTSSGGYTIHTFNTSGTLAPIASLSASYLIVAGGGGGGGYNNGAGGGAGGLLSGSGLTIDTNSTYVVTVGSGGAGGAAASGTSGRGTSGSNSTFSIYGTSAVGGGGGGCWDGGSGGITGLSGGSGGGGGAVSAAGGAATSGQGFAGGNAATSSSGGGGGAGAVGAVGTGAGGSGVGGAGGIGSTSSISGTSTYYAGGGGGGANLTQGAGGTGGGAAASFNGTAASGTANLGGGGGGVWGGTAGGSGGSGIVIISYAGATQSMAGGTVTISGGNVIHTFTSSGYLTPLKLVNNSLRLRRSASAYLNRTPTVASNRQTWTWSGWIKRGQLGIANAGLFGAMSGSETFDIVYEGNSGATADSLRFVYYNGSSLNGNLVTTALYRDPASWYHIVAVWDTTNATSANRMRLFVNGSEITAFSTSSYPSQNTSALINNTVAHTLGRYYNTTSYFDGYMAEVNFIDGQALTPNSFGTFNSYGVWQPITYGGSYGTNGFYLPFNPNTSSYAGYFGGSGYSLVTTATQIIPATGDFTIEAMINFGSLASTPVIVAQGTAGTAGRTVLFVNTSGGVSLASDSATTLTSNGLITTNRWYYIAATRSGANSSIYINGIKAIDNTTSHGTIQNTTLKVGVDWGGDYISSGYVSNVRISSVVRTISPTTAPTTNFTNDASTIFLTLQGATIVDNSSNAYAITNNGTVTTGKTYPFSYNVFNDQSPQGNNWTPNNISGITGSTLDYMTDVPTLTSATQANYCTINPLLDLQTYATYSNANLTINTTAGTGYAMRMLSKGTMPIPSTGKWYFTIYASDCQIMIGCDDPNRTQYGNILLSTYVAYTSAGAVVLNGTTVTTVASFTSANEVGFAIDMDASTVGVYKDGALLYTVTSAITSTFTYYPMTSPNSSSTTYSASWNFGQQPFKYAAPSGYLALNTYNI
jgi:hypothetical protein